jgi:hypothetical protein
MLYRLLTVAFELMFVVVVNHAVLAAILYGNDIKYTRKIVTGVDEVVLQ